MSDRCEEQLEIVGFNGKPMVERGRALPVARRPSDSRYCILRSLGETPPSWYSQDQADAFAASGRWTRFVDPIPLSRTCFSEIDRAAERQWMVFFADERMLDTADRPPRPEYCHDHRLIWRRLAGYAETLQAACGSSEAVEQLLDDWAKGLLRRFDALYHLGREPGYLKRIADFALCAARSRTLRWRAYLRYASVQEADRARSMFESFAHREFPGTSWEAFLEEVKSVCDGLRAVPRREPQPARPSSPASALPKMRGIAGAAPTRLEAPGSCRAVAGL